MNEPAVPRFGELAQRLVDNGYLPVPIWFRKKKPCAGEGWPNYRFQESDAFRFAQAGTGLLCGDTVGLDNDVKDPHIAAIIEELADDVFGISPRRIGQAPKALRMLRADRPFLKLATRGFRFPDDPPELKPHRVEILASGQQFVAFNIHEDTGLPYLWNGAGDPLTVPIGMLPEITEARAREFIAAAEQVLLQYGKPIGKLVEADERRQRVSNEELRAADPVLFRHALAHIPNSDLEFDDWIRVLYAVKGALGENGLQDFAHWSSQSSKDVPAFTADEYEAARPKSLGAGTIYYLAKQHGWERPARKQTPDPLGSLAFAPASQEADVAETVGNNSSGKSPRTVVNLPAGQLHLYADEAERLIAQDVYERAQSLVRIGMAPELASTSGIQRAQTQRVIVPVSVEYLRRKLNSVGEFKRYAKSQRKWVPIDCPKDLANNILGAGDWQHFRPLDGISTAPFIRADLTVCTTPGYDHASHTFYAPNASFPPLVDNPTKNDADEAVARLMDPFKEFPFDTEESKGAFLSHILSSVARHALDTVPVSVYAAPLAGTGKSLLSEMAGRIAQGAPPAVRPYSDDAEELRKVLMTALLAGDSSLLFDNIPAGTKLRSAILCGFVTAPTYSDRVLGVSEAPRLTNRCSVVLTGNNITPMGDLARRCCIIRLDANSESVRERKITIKDLRGYVDELRPRLLVDALTIIRAYIRASPTPSTAVPLPSFERWSRVARDPVIWLGYGDPVATQEVEADDELGPLKEAFEAMALWEAFTREFAARDLAKKCDQFDGEAVRSALEAAGCSDAANGAKVGYWLRSNRDRVAGIWKLKSPKNKNGSAVWKLAKPSGPD